jgi:hypothetical protein
MSNDNPTAAQINAHFSAMDDSVNLINATVADDSEALRNFGDASGVNLMITRNTDHLEIQLGRDWAIADNRSKTSYTDAITAGKSYVAG